MQLQMPLKIALLLLCSAVYLSYADDCEDDRDWCWVMKEYRKCGLDVAVKFCRLTCGHCSAPIPPKRLPTEECKDTDPTCEMNFYVCANDPSGAEGCRLTCQHCEGATEKPKPTRKPITTVTSKTEKPIVTSPPKELTTHRPPPPGCEDNYRWCHIMESNDACYLDITRTECKKSCHHCYENVTEIIAPTPECHDEELGCDSLFSMCLDKVYKADKCRQTCGLCGNTIFLSFHLLFDAQCHRMQVPLQNT